MIGIIIIPKIQLILNEAVNQQNLKLESLHKKERSTKTICTRLHKEGKQCVSNCRGGISCCALKTNGLLQ